MNKDNHVFANNITKKIKNNNETYCSYDKKTIKDETKYKFKNINQKINDIFNSRSYIYKADVVVKMKNGNELRKRVIGKNNRNLITSDNELILIDDIDDIFYQ